MSFSDTSDALTLIYLSRVYVRTREPVKEDFILSAKYYNFALYYNIYYKIGIRHSVISVINDSSDSMTDINLLRVCVRV